MLEYLLLLLGLICAAVRDHEALVAENLLLRQQLAVLTGPTRKRPRLRTRDRLFWVAARALRGDWRQHLVLVQPESVIRWHPQAWRLFWRWRSRRPLGRPRLSAEVRQLIATMTRDNPRRGSEQIPGELLKLELVVSKRSILAQTVHLGRYLGRGRLIQELVHPRPTEPDRRGDLPDRRSLSMSGEHRPDPFDLRGFQAERGQPQPLAEPLLPSPVLLELFARLHARQVSRKLDDLAPLFVRMLAGTHFRYGGSK